LLRLKRDSIPELKFGYHAKDSAPDDTKRNEELEFRIIVVTRWRNRVSSRNGGLCWNLEI